MPMKVIQGKEKYNVIKLYLVGIVCLLLSVAGCTDKESETDSVLNSKVDPSSLVFQCAPNENNALSGCWTEESCRKTSNFPGDDTHEKITYSYQNEYIFQRLQRWGNSDCNGEITHESDTLYPYANSYRNNTSTLLLSSGVTANILEVDGLSQNPTTYYVAYQIDNDRLCMTPDTLGENGVFQYTQINDLPDTIDYNICLITNN